MGEHRIVHARYTVAYREDGERKTETVSYEGKPTGKGYKAWEREMCMQLVMSILRDPNKMYLSGSWEGLGKRR